MKKIDEKTKMRIQKLTPHLNETLIRKTQRIEEVVKEEKKWYNTGKQYLL